MPELTSRTTTSLDSKFLPIRSDITDSMKRRLLAKVVKVGVRKVVQNHVYMWKGDYWLQGLGVPTGLRLSGIIGRVTMDFWKVEMARLMTENGLLLSQ